MRCNRKVPWLAVCALALGGGYACSDVESIGDPPKPELTPQSSFRANVGGFGCGLTYTVITETNDAELAPYEVGPMTDTARVCETWTGSDYQVEVTQIGSSEPATDYAEDIKTVVYQNGTTSAYDAYNGFAESQPDVGPTSFELVAATESERQASYQDPYYGVVASQDPNCSTSCAAYNRAGAEIPGIPSIPEIPGLRRKALKALLRGKSEIAPSAEGYRRFRETAADGSETTISVDPVTELIRRQEISNPRVRIVADLRWSKVRSKYVRDRMDVVSEEIVAGKSLVSRSTIRLTDVQWNASLGQ